MEAVAVAAGFEFQSTHPCGVRPMVSGRLMRICRGFNPRTPAGCDEQILSYPEDVRRFNPRTPAGCDEIDHPWRSFVQRFNPRTPAGCDKNTSQQVMIDDTFQSTHPCGVRRGMHDDDINMAAFQSTHPCGVRLGISGEYLQIFDVSIHAPLRGATHEYDGSYCLFYVSIHAPLRGATIPSLLLYHLFGGFNPRTPAGCDPGKLGGLPEGQLGFNPRTPAGCDACQKEAMLAGPPVSIHAPLRGATYLLS